MSSDHIQTTPELTDYIRAHTLREPDVLRRLREETARLPNGRMQITPEQGQLMGLLVEMLHAKDVLEIGVFTGYSSLAVARCLPSDGRLVACDVSVEYTDIAQRYWREAGVANRVDLRIGPALETLDRMIANGEHGQFDFIFIDADKSNYDAYYERSLVLVRSGGLIGIDNVLWHGRVIDPNVNDPDTEAIRALNRKLKDDPRISLSLLPIGDGLSLAVKRRVN